MNKTEYKATWKGHIIGIIIDYFSETNNLDDFVVSDAPVEHPLYSVTTEPDMITIQKETILFVFLTAILSTVPPWEIRCCVNTKPTIGVTSGLGRFLLPLVVEMTIGATQGKHPFPGLSLGWHKTPFQGLLSADGLNGILLRLQSSSR
jgi:hypothetical protein